MKGSHQRLLAVVATTLITLIGLVALAFLGTYYYLKPTLPDVATLKDLKLQVPLRVYSRDGRLIGQIGEQRRVPVRYEEIPAVVTQAVLAAEDDRFFSHPGVDWQGLMRAAFVAATTLEASQGGSTLTQQLVRTTLITKERKLARKLREIFLSVALENELSKEEILTLFVNTQFLGQRAYGFAAAAETYFGKRLDELTPGEAALLAGILQAPSRYNPVANPGLARERRAYVLRRMRELDYLDEPAYERAMNEPVRSELFGPRVEVDAPYVAELVRTALAEKYGERLYTDGFTVVTTVDSRLQRAADVALRSAVLEYDRRHGYRGPAGKVSLPAGADLATIESALEPYRSVGGLQPVIVTGVADKALTVVTRSGEKLEVPLEHMTWARKAGANATIAGPPIKRAGDAAAVGDVVYVLPEAKSRAFFTQVPDAQGAFVALDPNDGAIVALAGGFDFYAQKFNRATQARRQPGSAFKPFVYSAALEKGFTPASIILDAPVVFESGEAGDWRPENNEGRFYGPTPLREALVRSRNLVSIRLMREIGVGYTVNYVQRFGFPADHIPSDLTASLGTAQLTPLEVANGFAVFANGGHRVEPYLIERVEDATGKVLMTAQPQVVCRECEDTSTPGATVAPAIVPATGEGELGIADIGGRLPGVPEEQRAKLVISPANAFILTDMMRDVVRRGTARRALALNRGDLGGKTGTSNDRRDTWFSGFNADLVGTAWVGFDQERTLGGGEEGGRTALPMWVYFMQEALKGKAESRLPMPSGIVTARAGAEGAFEYFLAEHPPRAGDGDDSAVNPEAPGPDEAPIF